MRKKKKKSKFELPHVFAPVCVVGEPNCGKTDLILNYIRSRQSSRIDFTPPRYTLLLNNEKLDDKSVSTKLMKI